MAKQSSNDLILIQDLLLLVVAIAICHNSCNLQHCIQTKSKYVNHFPIQHDCYPRSFINYTTITQGLDIDVYKDW
jgi:hypothetical protein